MITLRSMRNLATLFSVALAVSGLMASFNYSATAEKQILGSLDALSPEIVLIHYNAVKLSFSQIESDMRDLQNTFGPTLSVAPVIASDFVLKNLHSEPLWGYRIQTTPKLYDLLRMNLHPKSQSPDNASPQRARQVCFLSKSLAPHLAGSLPPEGMSLLLMNQMLFVEGLFTCEDKLLGIDWNRVILTAFTPHAESGHQDKASLVVRLSGGVTKVSLNTIDAVLMRTRGFKNFSVTHFQGMLEEKRKITKAIRLLTETISLIILLMASISCMNIFFISVSERTREIGLRRALGAARHEILLLIMKDSYMFMGTGTALGLVGGYYFTHLLMRPLLLVMPEFAGWTFDANSAATMKTLAFLGAGATISGFFPALRATRIDPALALRE